MKKTSKIGAFVLLLALAFSGGFAQAQTGQTAKVTIVKFVDGSMANASTANSYNFNMNASWNALNLGGSGSGSYSLTTASTTGGNPTPYQTQTVALDYGSSYSTGEVVDGANVGSSCSTYASTNYPKFALVGYSTGDTLAAAKVAAKTTVAPNLTNITGDKYVIVWNKNCATKDNDDKDGNHTGKNGNGKLRGTVTGGQNSDTGTLKVTSITADNSTATADGSFEHGLKYTFNVTIPTDESHLSMKFADWTRIGGGGTIPVANNMRISSAQADNSGATVLLTAANTYSSPSLHLVTDLDPSTPGIQAKIVVEVAVPSSTPNGNYTTAYGVKTI